MKTKIIVTLVAVAVLAAGIGIYLFNSDEDENGLDLVSHGSYLKILGNSDGNHLLNDDDISIIQKYIDGEIDEEDLLTVTNKDTNETYYLADANADGTIDADDIAYLRGIMDRSGEGMNLIDTFGHLVNVPLNADRIACDYFATAELLMMVGVQDKIVCATNALMVLKDYYLQGANVENVVNYYSRTAPDFEAVEEANPQVWVVSEDYGPVYAENTTAAVVGLDMLVFDFEDIYSSSPIMSALLAGYIFNNVDKAIEYVTWYLGTWEKLYEKTSTLTSDQRPSVFYTGYGNYIVSGTQQFRVFLSNTVCWQAVTLAGGHNLIDDYPSTITPSARPTSNVSIGDLEWLMEQECDYVFAHCTRYTGSGTVSVLVPDHGYTCDDDSEYRAGQAHLGTVDILVSMCNPENMYLTPGDFMNGASGGLLSAILVAVTINPDLFPDLDLTEEHQKYIDMMGFDFEVSKNGTFYVTND